MPAALSHIYLTNQYICKHIRKYISLYIGGALNKLVNLKQRTPLGNYKVIYKEIY